MKKKVYCEFCKHFDSWHGIEKSCWSKAFDNQLSAIYKNKADRFNPGNPLKLNKNNDCKYFEEA